MKKDVSLSSLAENTLPKKQTPPKRRKKLSKSQEAKKKVLFEKFGNRWTYARLPYGKLLFLFHELKDSQSINKMYQYIVSGDLLFDGKYDVQDYSLNQGFDCSTKKEIITINCKKLDLVEGKHKDKSSIQTKEQFKTYLVSNGYLTAELFEEFFTHNRIPSDMYIPEVKIDFEHF